MCGVPAGSGVRDPGRGDGLFGGGACVGMVVGGQSVSTATRVMLAMASGSLRWRGKVRSRQCC
jgi:hypothetical protein